MKNLKKDSEEINFEFSTTLIIGIFIILLILKLTKLINLSWWIVFSPIFLVIGIVILIWIVFKIVMYFKLWK
jgi:hypothetical protein